MDGEDTECRPDPSVVFITDCRGDQRQVTNVINWLADHTEVPPH